MGILVLQPTSALPHSGQQPGRSAQPRSGTCDLRSCSNLSPDTSRDTCMWTSASSPPAVPSAWSPFWCGWAPMVQMPSALGCLQGSCPSRIWGGTTRLPVKPQAQGCCAGSSHFPSVSWLWCRQAKTQIFVGWSKHSYPAFMLSLSLPFFFKYLIRDTLYSNLIITLHF